jgi:hypothetical protein
MIGANYSLWSFPLEVTLKKKVEDIIRTLQLHLRNSKISFWFSFYIKGTATVKNMSFLNCFVYLLMICHLKYLN